MFESIYVYDAAGNLTTESALIAIGVSFALGLLVSLVYRFRSEVSRSLSVALIAMPVIVQLVILMVNNNAGTGVAVLGAFSLIRFRSVPGTARDILFIFLSMAAGIATGVGRIWVGITVVALVCVVMFILNIIGYGRNLGGERDLRITIPEDLDYTEVFDDIFDKYTARNRLIRVKTTNMGSLYELRYRIALKRKVSEKQFIDELRCRNGNLTIIFGRAENSADELSL
ncbi:MAG: DUF4956 domain-containing protein [Ruminococcaceae bacterium]|nr:DUF4956 domain-containing protein [Oscillospiraceae bacterium]